MEGKTIVVANKVAGLMVLHDVTDITPSPKYTFSLVLVLLVSAGSVPAMGRGAFIRPASLNVDRKIGSFQNLVEAVSFPVPSRGACRTHLRAVFFQSASDMKCNSTQTRPHHTNMTGMTRPRLAPTCSVFSSALFR